MTIMRNARHSARQAGEPSRRWVGAASVLGLTALASQGLASPPLLTAVESDPVALGWMQGFPPPPEKIIGQPDSDYFSFPKLRWTVCHFRELLPTRRVSRGLEASRPLPYALDPNIDAVTFTPLEGGDRDAFARVGYANLPGGSYRGMWWVLHNDHGAFAARGVHGQTIYVDPTARMVIVRFASRPVAGNAANDATLLPVYQALAEYLMGRKVE
ncbi:hypothetical protein [Halomonas sp. A11-A]|uniref:hypothetical protein n=1 Tax=Halomonas sp. A11-A TaxID=2183985 RepID=UPI000D98EAF7|nr:hypothetical protein [Halomonas sp. A11-A]PWV81760.1 hypothetical protein DER72_102231 [Halomonas sp. A11-A]